MFPKQAPSSHRPAVPESRERASEALVVRKRWTREIRPPSGMHLLERMAPKRRQLTALMCLRLSVLGQVLRGALRFQPRFAPGRPPLILWDSWVPFSLTSLGHSP
jgi:hypothetical protein